MTGLDETTVKWLKKKKTLKEAHQQALDGL